MGKIFLDNRVAQLLSPLRPLLYSERGSIALYTFRGFRHRALMQEVGRLRERAFRAAGGGTGQDVDVDADDFAEVPPPKFFRMKPGGEVRLMGAYIVKCNEVIKDENGKVIELHCTADLESGNGNPVDGRKVKGTIHWISAENAKEVDLMLYDKLFTIENLSDIPEDKTYNDYLNPSSLTVVENAKIEPSLADAAPGDKFQFVRDGYYCADTKHPGTFNRVVGLKDSFPKK